MKQYRSIILAAIGICSGVGVARADDVHRLTVSAGKFDRVETLVEVKLPPDVTGVCEVDDAAGHRSPLEIHDGQGWFVLRDLPANKSRTYTINHIAQGAAPQVQDVSVTKDGGVLHISIRGKEAFEYQGEKTPLPPGFEPQYQRGGYIYPVVTPTGKLVVDDYPPLHKHHHGIWSPWTKTEFEDRHPDFWNMGDKTGTVEPVSFGKEFSGPVVGGFHAEHRMVDLSAKPAPKVAINEQWDVMAYSSGGGDKPFYLFDLAIHQQCASTSPLILPKYHYGGLGIRGNRTWDGTPNCTFLTSEGKDRAAGNETRANWCYIGGKVDGKPCGVTLFCGTDNFRAPQPLRLHPTEPYLCWSPEQLGQFDITPDKPYAARYRFMVADGDPDKALIERVWNDYANPPEAKVE